MLFSAVHPPEARTDDTRTVIMDAMRDELRRNIERLSLENMERPFFISYNLYDTRTVEIVASLGSIVRFNENRNRNSNVRVMVGDYSLNDENFEATGLSAGSSMIHGSGRLPIENDYDGIRRSLWLATDDVYKRAAEAFEQKKAALKQQTVTEEAMIDDFAKAPVLTHLEPQRTYEVDRRKWERFAGDLSRVFRKYPDIYSSYVRLLFYRTDMFFVNSEGTEVIQPLTIAAVQVNAYTQAEDGEPLSHHFAVYRTAPGELPGRREMLKAVERMAEELTALRTAPVFEDSYFGPVMFEKQAAAEFFAQRLFSGKSGLIAYRRPITENRGYGYSDDDITLDDRMGRRILSRDLSIKALPGMEEYDGMKLLGRCAVDMEGVRTPPELVLVENGILKTLLTNRTPTPKIRESNGHQRPVIGNGYWTSSTTGPSVVAVTTSDGKSDGELKEELLRRAREEGLEYGILVRALKPYITGAQYYDPMVRMTSTYGRRDGTTLTKPILIYKVYVDDGPEELVRSAKLGSVTLSTLRHIAASSGRRYCYNTLTTSNWRQGIPASFIVPEKIILEELEVKKEKRDYTPKPPVVPSPLAAK